MRLGQDIACEVRQEEAPFRSRWVRSCLHKAERALRAAPTAVRAIDAIEGIANYRSVMDAAVACLLPELRGAMEAFYSRRGPPLRHLPAEVIERADRAIAAFAEAAEGAGYEAAWAAAVAARVK